MFMYYYSKEKIMSKLNILVLIKSNLSRSDGG